MTIREQCIELKKSGKSYKEISSIVGITPEAVSYHVNEDRRNKILEKQKYNRTLRQHQFCLHCKTVRVSEKTNKFCSKECLNLSQYKSKCLVCNKLIKSNIMYCSTCKKLPKLISVDKKCSSCNQVKSKDLFYKTNTTGILSSKCKECTKKVKYDTSTYVKMKCVEYKGGKCSICGYSKCIKALEFHHLDPSQKDFSITKARELSWDNQNERITKELDKCILLCSNCHRELHSSLNTGTEN